MIINRKKNYIVENRLIYDIDGNTLQSPDFKKIYTYTAAADDGFSDKFQLKILDFPYAKHVRDRKDIFN